MKIEKGKYYRNGKGEKIGPMRRNKHADGAIYRWRSRSETYTSKGQCYSWCISKKDLVEEWAESAPEPEPVVIQREEDPDIELHKLGCFSLEMLRTLTQREKDQLQFLYQTFYSTLLPIHLEDHIHNEIGKLWRLSRERLRAGIIGESLEGQPPWYLAGKESARGNA